MPYFQDGSIINHGATMAGTGTSSAAAQTASTLIAASALVSTESAVPTSASGVNITQVVADQAAMQAGMDSTTPRNLYLAFGCLLLFCMIVSHTRFLARLFASMHSSKKGGISSRQAAYPFDTAGTGSQKVERVVGGGDLTTGWVLKAGETRTTLLSPITPYSEKMDPFASPLDGPANHFPQTSSPTQYPPPHITPLLSHLPFANNLHFAPFSRLPNVFATRANLITLYFIVCYLLLISFALIWRSDITPLTKEKGYGADFYRSGLVALAQIPLVTALGVRGNILGLCIGKSYEKLKIFHKIVGRMLFLSATAHVVFYLNKWVVAGKFTMYASKPFIIAGFIGWGAMTLVAVTSLPWVRKAWFGVFEVCHFIGMILMLVGLCFHVKVAVPWCFAALAIYAISIFSSLTKTRLATAEITALPSCTSTLITVPALRSGWRAGQHVRIRIPALGLAHGIQGHPFSIASVPDGEGLVLIVKAAGDWTERLYEFAAGGQGSLSMGERGQTRQTINSTVILEGPYGGLGNTLLPSFSGILLVAGGSGITHALGVAHDLISRAPTGVVRARTIDLVWVIRTEEIAKPLMPTLLDMLDNAKTWEQQCIDSRQRGGDAPEPTALRIKIYVTRCPASSPLSLLDQPPVTAYDFDADSILLDRAGPNLRRQPSEADREKWAYLSRNPSSSSTFTLQSKTKNKSILSEIVVEKYRPNFPGILAGIADEVIARHGRSMIDPSGVCVTACGPGGLVNDVRGCVRSLEGWKRRACGGVELEEEAFGF